VFERATAIQQCFEASTWAQQALLGVYRQYKDVQGGLDADDGRKMAVQWRYRHWNRTQPGKKTLLKALQAHRARSPISIALETSRPVWWPNMPLNRQKPSKTAL